MRGFVFDIGTVTLTEYDADGFLGLQMSVNGDAKSGAEPFETHHPFGFLSRPRDPDPDGRGCYGLYAWDGSQGHVWPGQDARMASSAAGGVIPELGKGSSVMYGANGSFALFQSETPDGVQDGTFTLYVPVEYDGSAKPTKAHIVLVGKDANGKPTISLIHSSAAYIAIGENEITATTGEPSGSAAIILKSGTIGLAGDIAVAGNFAAGPSLIAWMAAVTTALTGLGAPPPVPPPISLST